MNTSKSNNKNGSKNNNHNNHNHKNSIISAINSKVILDSLRKLDPRYLAKNNPVMFTVELGFLVVLFVAIFPNISETFVTQNQIFYIEVAIILILTVWFATFSESLSEAQAES